MSTPNEPQRLPSLKPPRDLTLGAKSNKKVFTPNLIVSRKNKNKVIQSPPTKLRKDDKDQKERSDKNKNFRNVPNIIKSAGVFSEGMGRAEKHASRNSFARDSESTSSLRKQTLRIKDFVKKDTEREEERIKTVVHCDVDLTHDHIDEYKHILELDEPVTLPLDTGGYALNQKKTRKFKRTEFVKEEPDETEGVPKAKVESEFHENLEALELLKSKEPTLILLQLPESLPGRGRCTADEDPPNNLKTDEPKSTSENNAEENTMDVGCNLSDLEEGRIGKLLVYRSGRIAMALGDSVFDVSSGTKSSFHQEVVSVATDDTSRSANIVSLGTLHHKLNVVPRWDNMFANIVI